MPLSFDGVRGRRTPLPTPFTNLVGVAGPNAEVPDESITAVFNEFSGREVPFGWLLGPNSPNDLAGRLEQRGMVQVEEFAGLALTDLERDIRASEHGMARVLRNRPSSPKTSTRVNSSQQGRPKNSSAVSASRSQFWSRRPGPGRLTQIAPTWPARRR